MTDKTTAALKLAEEALNAMLTHMGMDEDEWTKPTFDQSRKTLAAIREARAEQEKQEPVAIVDANDDGYWADILPDRDVKVGQLLYAAPVSVEVIRAEALEQAAKVCVAKQSYNAMHANTDFAAAIRGLK